jgi:hypothetical protein
VNPKLLAMGVGKLIGNIAICVEVIGIVQTAFLKPLG